MGQKIKLGICSLLWNNPTGDDIGPWLKEVKNLGYDGISGFAEWGWQEFLEDGPGFNRLLSEHGLELASLIVGFHFNFYIYRKIFSFMEANRCVNLVCLGAFGKEAGDFRMVGSFLNYLGQEAKKYGIRVHYHNHSDNTGETFNDMRQLLEVTDPEFVSVMCDVGHATKDFIELPVKDRAITFLNAYKDRLSFIELKDWNCETGLNTPLGEGSCDFDRVFEFMRDNSYEGWVVVEQNGHEGKSKGREPRECAFLSREFIRNRFGI